MSYVFFDLEWNQGYPRSEDERIEEIIQIGAYRLKDWQDGGEAFSAYVRPTIHKKLHHQVKKLLPLDQAALQRADHFRTVAQAFFDWCGPDALFFTWGNSDARVLDSNLCWYRMEEYLDFEIYDLQHAYDLLVLGSNQQASLHDAVERLKLDEDDRVYHDAGNDAFFTARIAQAMIREFGALPSPERLEQMDEELYERNRQAARTQALEGLNRLLEEGEPAFTRVCLPRPTEDEQLRSRAARVFRCPKCENLLCNGNWYRLGSQCVARGRCTEHGRFYTFLTLKRIEQIGCTAEVRVYDAEHFDAELFHQCKLGGDVVVVTRPKPGSRHKRGRKYRPAPRLTPEG